MQFIENTQVKIPLKKPQMHSETLSRNQLKKNLDLKDICLLKSNYRILFHNWAKENTVIKLTNSYQR